MLERVSTAYATTIGDSIAGISIERLGLKFVRAGDFIHLSDSTALNAVVLAARLGISHPVPT
jgi:hypothetical protein